MELYKTDGRYYISATDLKVRPSEYLEADIRYWCDAIASFKTDIFVANNEWVRIEAFVSNVNRAHAELHRRYRALLLDMGVLP